MTIGQALVLGIIQGVAEFLPISSSGHLVIVPWLFHWADPGLSFDIALHMGTLLAVVVFFGRDWLTLIDRGIRKPSSQEGKLCWLLVVSTVPGALLGYLLERQAETIFRTPLLTGVLLVAMGIVLYLADVYAAGRKGLMQVRLPDSLWIGFSQALAIIPGVSRSGITMACGRIRGLSREAAARFSFLMSTPVILGAGLLKLNDISWAKLDASFWTGVISSAVVGFLSIGFLLRYLTRRNFGIFVWYRLALGLLVIVVSLWR